MASFNKVILMGNLTRDPELRMTPKGTAVCQIGVAVNQSYKDKDGNAREETTFVDIDVFGRQAEVISKYMTKGRPILIEGRLKLDSWESKEGEKRSKLKVVLENFQFVGAASGAAINLLFVTSFQKTASGHFVVRRLERKYGLDVVKSAYEAIAKRGGHHSSAAAAEGR